MIRLNHKHLTKNIMTATQILGIELNLLKTLLKSVKTLKKEEIETMLQEDVLINLKLQMQQLINKNLTEEPTTEELINEKIAQEEFDEIRLESLAE